MTVIAYKSEILFFPPPLARSASTEGRCLCMLPTVEQRPIKMACSSVLAGLKNKKTIAWDTPNNVQFSKQLERNEIILQSVGTISYFSSQH